MVFKVAVGGHDTDSVSHIVEHSDWNTSSTGGDWTEAWTDSDGVVDWSPTIVPWGLPLHCEDHTVPTILLNSGGGSSRRGRDCCREGNLAHTYIYKSYKSQTQ